MIDDSPSEADCEEGGGARGGVSWTGGQRGSEEERENHSQSSARVHGQNVWYAGPITRQ